MKRQFSLALAFWLLAAPVGAGPDRPSSSGPDDDASIRRFAGALRYETTNDQEARPKVAAFLQFHDYLARSFPRVHAQLTRETINELSLLYTWKGSDPVLEPVLYIAHQDVVPVDHPEGWAHPPFAGVVADGMIYGRGALDDKFALVGMLEGIEGLLAQGFQPRRTMYLAFGHDEEIMGTRGAEPMAKLLAQRGITCKFALDEGPPVVQGLMPGIDKPVAFIGTATKGQLYLRLEARGMGGHGSIPPNDTPISILSKGITRLYEHRFPRSLTEPVRQSLQTLAPAMPFANRLVSSNLWLFEGLVLGTLEKDHLSRALVTTTVAANIFKGGEKDATVPTHAEAVVNIGILPGQTVASAIDDVRRIVADPRVEVSMVTFPDNKRPHVYEPTAPAPTDGWEYASLQAATQDVFPEALVAPTLMPGGSDGKHFMIHGVTPAVYYFNPLDLTPELLEGMHGVNERLPAKSYLKAVRFYRSWISQLNPAPAP